MTANGKNELDANRDWRDAKIPQWVTDAVQAEIDNAALTAALSWPTEAKPSPLPFGWTDYDREYGSPVAGKYWTISGRSLEIRHKTGDDKGPNVTTWKTWMFRAEGYNWSTSVTRGDLFATQHDAKLAALWGECEACAKKLLARRKWVNE